MIKKIVTLCILLCFAGCGYSGGSTGIDMQASKLAASTAASSKKIVGYFTSWSIYGRGYNVADIPADKLTHINYAFANISSDGKIMLGDSYADIEKSFTGDTWDQAVRGNFNQLIQLKNTYPHLKTLISVGGWTWSGKFSDVALTQTSRQVFAASCVEFIRTYGFDGVDIDWEYPVAGGLDGNTRRPEDKANFTLLMQELRAQLDQAGSEDGTSYLLTVATTAGADKIINLELDKVSQYLDWINIMNYDFHGGWESTTNHHAQLYANPDDPSTNDAPAYIKTKYNAHAAVQQYLDAGVPAGKLVYGTPFYGRGWKGVADNNNGLFQSATGAPKGTWDDWESGDTGVFDYSDLKDNYLSSYGQFWDESSQVPWLYSPSTGIMISYENTRSIAVKCDYIINNNLAGAMCWELSCDRDYDLLNVLYEKLWDADNTEPTLSPVISSIPSVTTNNAITINGNNFSGSSRVHIAGTNVEEDAVILSYTANRLVCQNQYAAGTYTVKIYNSDLASNEYALTITEENSTPTTFKVVGYQPSWSGDVQAIQYDKLTHINYAFILPTADGGLTAVDNAAKLQNLVSLAHASNVKVLIAIGGWNDGNDSPFESMAADASARARFVENCLQFVAAYDLDGVDIDWEYPDPWGDSSQNFTYLMQDLSTALHARGKLLTAAVVALGNTAEGIGSAVFEYVDFLNLMAYDGGDGANHSPYSYAVDSLNYWLNRGLPKEKAIIGVPFYGRPGGTGYCDIVASDPEAPYKDVSNGIYYNGIQTIKDKTQLALTSGGGIMIWEISKDTTGDTSLLQAIHEEAGDTDPEPEEDPVISSVPPVTEGSNILIYGSNFSSDCQVYISGNGVEGYATVLSTSSTSITCLNSYAAGTYQVVVYKGSLSSNTSTLSITVAPSEEAPMIASVPSVREGSNIVITGSNFSSACQVHISGNGVEGYATALSTSSTSITCLNSYAAGTYQVIVYKETLASNQVTLVITTASSEGDTWQEGVLYHVGDRVIYNGVTYSCVQEHTAIVSWEPDTTPTLWQPVDDNAASDAWQPNTSYAAGDEVSYNGSRYRCLQAHTSLTGWEPDVTPALWTEL